MTLRARRGTPWERGWERGRPGRIFPRTLSAF